MNPNCTACELHHAAHSICLKGWGTSAKSKLLIYLDSPNISEDRSGVGGKGKTAEILFWLIQRMGLSLEDVAFDFVLKCSRGKQLSKKADRFAAIEACTQYRLATIARLKPKAIVAMGQVPCEAFLSREVGDSEGCKWVANEPEVRKLGVEEIWVTYSPSYLIEKPSESYRIYRVLFRAAEEANLKPNHTKLKHQYQFQ